MKKTYAIPNPFWLSDIFVFREYDKKIKTIYVKINHEGKIEEIGIDISKRMHGWELENITKHKTCTEATDVQKSILDTIGDEYWYGIYNREKVENIMEKRKCMKYKDELKKEYDKLVSEIEETRMYDGRGKGVDVYLCERCNGVFLTRYKDKGVTPFIIKCRWCNEGNATHKSTVSEQTAEEICKRQGITVKEWVRPTFEQLLKMSGGIQAHVLEGGLVLDGDC